MIGFRKCIGLDLYLNAKLLSLTEDRHLVFTFINKDIKIITISYFSFQNLRKKYKTSLKYFFGRFYVIEKFPIA